MRFADPSQCPSCASPIRTRQRCTNCGFDLNSPAARELWQTLLRADQLLEQARTAAAQPAAAPKTETLPKAPPMLERSVKRSVSAGSVLLGLGALFILAAGIIFITVAWGSLGVTGRALVLLAFTAVVGVLAAFVTRRELRASAEALWSVFLGLVTIDWFAAWGQGLFGLDAVSGVVVTAVWSVVMFVVSSYIVRQSRPRLEEVQLIAPMIVAGLAPWLGAAVIGVQLYDNEGWGPFWAALSATAFIALLLAVSLRLKHNLTSILLAGAGAFGVVFLGGTALADAIEHPSIHELAAERHGLPVVVLILLAVGAGYFDRRIAIGSAIVTVLGLTLLVALPIEDANEARGGLIAVSGVLVLGALALRHLDPWSLGARIAIGLLGIGLAVAALPWLATLGSMIEESFDSGDGSHTFWTRPTGVHEGAGPWWLAAIVFGALAVATALARWWPEGKTFRGWVLPAAFVLLAVGIMVGLAAGELPFAVAALVAIAIGAALSEVPPRDDVVWSLIGPVIVALAPVLPLPSRAATLAVWLAAAAVLAVLVTRSHHAWRREASAFAAAAWGLGAIGIATVLADQSDRYVSLSLVIAAAVGLALASTLLRSLVGRRGIEAATVVVAAVGIGIGSLGDVSLGWLAAIWTVLGASVSLISLFAPDRPYFRWVGFGALGFAYVLRLVASDVETVEAYTLPFGAVLLAAGLWWMRGKPEITTTRALGSGLLLALLPSLPLALDEPTGLRALLVGIGAFVTLAVGVAKRWKAPFIIGAVILLLLVIVNVGPLAMGLPRWVLIAGAGGLLLGAGVTWEDRVRDGRAVAAYVTSMR